ncbi:MAG: hybrid sensor histidine kinase/response regulator [Leptolyngbya sp. SIO3F4]|nr:hybrid sensor histidine kinase/response regulator [Leptolyngbya sp. SIO3F4]
MASEQTIPQQVPAYFLQEASELLQQIDTELQTLSRDFSVQKMHSLMRAAHTLKGAAASVGLDAIKTTTHSLEDAFKALCVPDATLTSTVEGLIFEVYDCLQLLLSAQISKTQIDESSILDRIAGIVTKLQHNLGDQFGQDGYLPTSTDLGFDMTQSIFEIGVNQRLDDLENALKSPEPDALKELLQTQADVFWGLAESLNLPGFGEIVKTTLAALNQHPDQVVQIATIALEDYRNGQNSILQGDRTQGGAPSEALKSLATAQKKRRHRHYPTQKSSQATDNISWFRHIWQRLNTSVGVPRPVSKVEPKSLELLEEELSSPTPDNNISNISQVEVQSPDSIWETAAVELLQDATTDSSEQISPDINPLEHPNFDEYPNPETDTVEPNDPFKETTLRISLSHLEQLNHTIGELLTQQNRQSLYNERLTVAMKTLLFRLRQQQQQLHKLQRQTIQTSAALHLTPLTSTEDLFDSLELDHYSELQLMVQASLETMVQQMESAEAVELFVRQNGQALEKQQRLVDDLRETVLDARMQPLGALFNRFDQVLSRLSMQHSKPVALIIRGEDALVDKAIVDKLYDPLLHLVRNAFDHGIETPDVRQQQGKTQKAAIQLSASQTGRYLVIQIQDNGQGLNLSAIRQKAIENELISTTEAQNLTPDQISDLIFEPDLSTATQVNDLSGRGVGLDVVRAQVQALRGTVTVVSRPGRGTCFTLNIPANLSIAKMLLCQAGDKLYALMTDTIEQILIPRSGQLQTQNNRKILKLKHEGKGQLIPVIPLSEALTYHASLPEIHDQELDNTSDACPIILMRSQNHLVGLEIDQLLGEQELVIRSLGDMSTMPIPTYIYGCSILPDGRLSLVVDGAALTLKLLEEFVAPVTEKAGSRTLKAVAQRKPKPPAILKQSILVMDDSVTVRNTLTQALQKAGYLVLQAKDGTEGLRKLDQANVAAILCDLEMPGMNGFEFLKVRQQFPKIASIPTIMLTSRTGAKHQQLAQTLGATDYLTKPYLTPQLLATLTNVLA